MQRRFLFVALAFVFSFSVVSPYSAYAVDKAVPDREQGYVPHAPSEEVVDESENPEKDKGNFITRGIAGLINMLASLIEFVIGRMDLEEIIFSESNPINAKKYDSNSVGRIFSAAEWNNAINPLRIAFTFVAWTFFAVMIAMYGMRVMTESTNPLKRTQLQENLYAWIGAAGMLAFMHMFVFIIFNLNWAFVKGLKSLISGNEAYGDAFETLKSVRAVDGDEADSITNSVIGDAIVNFSFSIMTAVLVIRYMFRKFIIGFLVIISPMAAISFARKKDGMAFKMWLAEIMSQVFMQTGHALVIVVYFAFLNASVTGSSGIFSNLGTVKNQVATVINPILGFLISIGGVVAIGALIYNGIRLSVSSGNPQARTSAIKGIQMSLIGGLICVGAVIVVNVLRGLMF